MNSTDPAPDPPSSPATTVGKVPASKRGVRTREALISAARLVFERDGYVETRINDIPVAAGLAVGTFYTYFDSKEEILAAVLESVSDAMIYPHLDHVGDPTDVRVLIEENNRAYLMAYRDNANLMRLFEQLAQVDPQFRALRRKRAREFARRSARTIRRLQEQQRADAGVDPYYAALALAGMVGRMAYTVYVDGERVPFEALLATVTDLWVNALHIDQAP